MSTDGLANYLRDLVFLLREAAEEARGLSESDPSDYQKARAFAYAEVLALMQSQAGAFDLPRNELGLEGFDPIAALTNEPRK